MTTQGKVFTLLQRLHDKTGAGGIIWEATPARRTFQAAFTNLIVKISDEGNDNYSLAIYDEAGTLIEEMSDRELALVSPNVVAPFTLMCSLYSMARRQALGVDAALDALIGELG